jgi:hypothetical protein
MDQWTQWTRDPLAVTSLGVEALRLNLTTQKPLMRSGFPNLGPPPHMLCTRDLGGNLAHVYQSTAMAARPLADIAVSVMIG